MSPHGHVVKRKTEHKMSPTSFIYNIL